MSCIGAVIHTGNLVADPKRREGRQKLVLPLSKAAAIGRELGRRDALPGLLQLGLPYGGRIVLELYNDRIADAHCGDAADNIEKRRRHERGDHHQNAARCQKMPETCPFPLGKVFVARIHICLHCCSPIFEYF